MGKSNRIRVNRANEKVKSPNAKKKGNGMPSWALTLITVLVTAALLLSVCGILLSANGVFGRMITSVKSENFKVNQNMMTYFFNNQYSSFTSTYSEKIKGGSSSTSSNAEGMLSLDTSKDLKDQEFLTSDKSILGVADKEIKTWHDYIMAITTAEVKSMLIYCEYANDNKIKLDKDDKSNIDSQIENFKLYSNAYGYPTVNAFLSSQYGDGINTSDVKDCMELTTLASKASQDISDKLEKGILTAEIEERYNAEKLNHNVVDYSFYTFTVLYSDIEKKIHGKANPTEAEKAGKKSEVDAAYKAAIEKARADAKTLSEIGSLEKFQNYMYERIAYEQAPVHYGSQTIDDKIKPTVEGVAADKLKEHFSDKIAADVLEEILAGKEDADPAVEIPEEEKDQAETYEVYGTTVKTDYAEIINAVKTKTFASVYNAKTGNNLTGKKYNENDATLVWAFADTTKVGDTRIVNAGDGANTDGTVKEDITISTSNASITVYYMVKPQYKDTTLSKNFTYMTFAKEADATAAIEALKAAGAYNAEAFLKVAEEKKAEYTETVTDYMKGDFGISAFDEWLFDEKTTPASITATPINTGSDTTYVVALYEGVGNEQWYIDVKGVILTERAEAEAKSLEKKYTITENDWSFRFVNLPV